MAGRRIRVGVLIDNLYKLHWLADLKGTVPKFLKVYYQKVSQRHTAGRKIPVGILLIRQCKEKLDSTYAN